MAANAPGSDRPLIDVVRDATRGLAELLPNDSELGIWVFGSRLDPPRDYRTLLKPGLLNSAQRSRLVAATGRLAAESTGSGLYATLLAAYRAALNSYREGIPCHLILFTARHGVDDPGSLTAAELQKGLRTLLDPARPVNVTIVSFGPHSNAEALEELLKPVDGYVDPVSTAEQVRAVFIHMAAGGVHH